MDRSRRNSRKPRLRTPPIPAVLAWRSPSASSVGAAVVGMCTPVSTQAGISASPDASDIHPDWEDGSQVGLPWTFEQRGAKQGEDGNFYLFGDLLVVRDNVVNRRVCVSDMERECEAAQ